jgi:cytochrome c peroxidase
VWRQPLFALENEREMNFTRAEVAHFIAQNYTSSYEAVFGSLPDLSDVPLRAHPGDAAWDALSPELQNAVDRVFVNTGKALEAYERRLVCADTRFDRGDIQLTLAELDGAARFPLLDRVHVDDGDIEANATFLHTLDCPAVPASPLAL